MKLKSILMATAIMMLTTSGLFAQNSKNSKTLVMYFSWGGTTEKMAKMISSSNGGELFRIEPTKDYPTSYTPCTKVVKEELDNGIFRQVKKAPDFSKYDTIFVGVPVWWHTAPTLMTHFLEENKEVLKGKTIIPFCTYQYSRGKFLSSDSRCRDDADHLFRSHRSVCRRNRFRQCNSDGKGAQGGTPPGIVYLHRSDGRGPFRRC